MEAEVALAVVSAARAMALLRYRISGGGRDEQGRAPCHRSGVDRSRRRSRRSHRCCCCNCGHARVAGAPNSCFRGDRAASRVGAARGHESGIPARRVLECGPFILRGRQRRSVRRYFGQPGSGARTDCTSGLHGRTWRRQSGSWDGRKQRVVVDLLHANLAGGGNNGKLQSWSLGGTGHPETGSTLEFIAEGGRATILWTYSARGIYGIASRNDSNQSLLNSWWSSIGSFVEDDVASAVIAGR